MFESIEVRAVKKQELLIKSREAMLSAVQIYNNPQVSFKSETFITLAIIAWTYLLHAYYANNGIDYRYSTIHGKRKIYDRTKYGAYKHWELERCLNDKYSPVDEITSKNLKFLIGVRHEIEHQMTKKIDASISAKIHACSLNYNYYIKKLFGENYGIDSVLGIAIQFSPIDVEQKNLLQNNEFVKSNLQTFITEFEKNLTEAEFNDTHYAYRVVFARVDGKRKNSLTDEVISFIPSDDPRAKDLKANYAVITEKEKKKYFAKEVVAHMKSLGFDYYSISYNTYLWKEVFQIDRENTPYGVFIGSTFLWYENWVKKVEEYCNAK